MGVVNPVADLCARARKLGIVTIVDGAQSAGHMTVDVQAIGCDFFAFSGHRFAARPASARFTGGWRFSKTPTVSGRWRNDPDRGLRQDGIQTRAASFRGRHADISGPIGLHAAMDYLDAIGRDNILEA